MLTRRQLEVAALLAKGCSNAEVASRLGIAWVTVNSHVTNIRKKLRAKNVRQMMFRLGQEARRGNTTTLP